MARREKKPPKHIQMDKLNEHIKQNKIYNMCTNCKDKHEIGNTKGEYSCPACGWSNTIK